MRHEVSSQSEDLPPALQPEAPIISASQCRAARAFLDWTHRKLAERAGISVCDLRLFERGHSSMVRTAAALRAAFEAEGINIWSDEDVEHMRFVVPHSKEDLPTSSASSTGVPATD